MARQPAVNVLQSTGLLLDDVENLLAKLAHQFLGVDRADALDHAAPQILLDAFLGGRRSAGEHDGAELETKLAVLDPASFGGQPFSGADGRKRANDGDQVAVPLGFDLEHAKTVLLVKEGNALD